MAATYAGQDPLKRKMPECNAATIFFFFNELPPHLLCQTLNGCTKLLKESYSDGYEYRKAPHASACLQRWDDTQVTYCVMKTHRGDTRLKLVPTALMFSFLFRLTCSWCNND